MALSRQKKNESERNERTKKNHSISERCKSFMCCLFVCSCDKEYCEANRKKESATVVDVIKLMIIDFSVEQNWRLWIFFLFGLTDVLDDE